ncbi:MAG: hypothetical protein FWG75_05850 [Cystobacterineae bacterium]|nr:hypothetical protein [Cystobacterineae bacterium]
MNFCLKKPALYAALAYVLMVSLSHAAQRKINLEPLGNPSVDPTANDRFRAFARQLALSFSPQSPSPPHTLGWHGSSANAFISIEKPSWEALEELNRKALEKLNPNATGHLFPQSLPLWTQLGISARKGLPYSFEVGVHAKWLTQSSMWTLAGDLKWAFNEGIDYLPDFSIRVHLQQLFGASPLKLTTGGMDLNFGHSLALPNGSILSIFGGWDLVFVYAASQPIPLSNGTPEEAKFDSLKPFSNSHNRVYAAFKVSHWDAFVQLGLSYSLLKTPISNQQSPDNKEVKFSTLFSANFSAGYMF